MKMLEQTATYTKVNVRQHSMPIQNLLAALALAGASAGACAFAPAIALACFVLVLPLVLPLVHPHLLASVWASTSQVPSTERNRGKPHTGCTCPPPRMAIGGDAYQHRKNVLPLVDMESVRDGR